MNSLLAIGKFARANGAVWVYSDQGRKVTVETLFQKNMMSIFSSSFVRKDMASRVIPKDFRGLKNRWSADDERMLKIYGRDKYKFILGKEGDAVSPLLVWGTEIVLSPDAEIKWGEADGVGFYNPTAFQNKIPEKYRSDPRFLVAWLSHHANLPGKDGAISTADYGITLMEIAMFAHENRHLVVTTQPLDKNKPVKVWHLFMDTSTRIGDILCTWKQMMLVFKVKPGASADGGALKVLAELAGSMNDLWDAAEASLNASKLCPAEPPK